MSNSDAIEDRKRVASLPQLRDVFGYNASCAEDEAQLASRRYEYALEQRDRLNERIRFGCLTLNAASLLALTTIVGDQPKLLALGLNQAIIGFAALLFGLGVVCGAFAIWANGVHFIRIAADAFQYRMRTRHLQSLFSARINEQSEKSVSDALAEERVPATDFAYSKATMHFTSLSGGFWLGGLGLTIGSLAGKMLGFS